MRNKFYKSPNNFANEFKMSPKNRDIIKHFQDKYFTVLHGAAQSSKSVIAAICLALLIENAPEEEDLFGALGYTEGTAKANVGTYLLWYFGTERCCINSKYNNFSCAEIITSTGIKRVLFLGGSNASSNNPWHGQRIAGFVADELDRLHPNSITEMLQRTTKFDHPHIICTMNPTFETHPVYQLIDSWIKSGICTYYDVYITDNPIMTPEKIEQVRKRYPEGTTEYKRYFLGQRVSESDPLLKVYDYNLLKEFHPEDYISYIISMDVGETISATSIGCFALKYSKDNGNYQLDCIKVYHHLNKDLPENLKKMPSDYAEDLYRFKEECHEMFGVYPIAIIIDDTWSFFTEVKRAFIKNESDYKNVIRPIKEKDEERIRSINNLTFNKQLNFYYPNSVDTVKELKNLQIDQKELANGKIRLDNSYNVNGHSDAWDMVCYAVAYYKPRLIKQLKGGI